jgi:SAM-dependent methyltransferase
MPEGPAHPRFPAVSFVSRAEFDAYVRASGPELDALFRYERRLATTEPVFYRPGTCAPCLRPALFTVATAGGEVLPGGRRVPNWREEFVCDCADRLCARFRATLHFLQGVVGISSWTRLLLFGPGTPLDRRLRALMPLTRVMASPAWADGRFRLEADTASLHLALALDVLHLVPPLDAALAEFRRVLVGGGQLVFTVPFRAVSNETISRLDRPPGGGAPSAAMRNREVHEFGWDLLPRLRAAGFRRAWAHCYRSEELGYCGPFLMIFSAEA